MGYRDVAAALARIEQLEAEVMKLEAEAGKLRRLTARGGPTGWVVLAVLGATAGVVIVLGLIGWFL
jgi:hypothetical protein